MGSFTKPESRMQRDTAFLTEGLAEGESIQYWKSLPHSVSQRISTAAAKPNVDSRGRFLGVDFDAGQATGVRLKLGIVTWKILDEDGNPVPWDPNRSEELLDGLDPAIVQKLSELIGKGDPEPDLNDPVDPNAEVPEGHQPVTVGEGFAGSSAT